MNFCWAELDRCCCDNGEEFGSGCAINERDEGDGDGWAYRVLLLGFGSYEADAVAAKDGSWYGAGCSHRSNVEF